MLFRSSHLLRQVKTRQINHIKSNYCTNKDEQTDLEASIAEIFNGTDNIVEKQINFVGGPEQTYQSSPNIYRESVSDARHDIFNNTVALLEMSLPDRANLLAAEIKKTTNLAEREDKMKRLKFLIRKIREEDLKRKKELKIMKKRQHLINRQTR